MPAGSEHSPSAITIEQRELPAGLVETPLKVKSLWITRPQNRHMCDPLMAVAASRYHA